jgi:hypothetical protein
MDINKPTVVWEQGPVVCTSRMFAPDHIEIVVTFKGAPIDRKRFSDSDAAAAFAIDKMRAYNAG